MYYFKILFKETAQGHDNKEALSFAYNHLPHKRKEKKEIIHLGSYNIAFLKKRKCMVNVIEMNTSCPGSVCIK